MRRRLALCALLLTASLVPPAGAEARAPRTRDTRTRAVKASGVTAPHVETPHVATRDAKAGGVKTHVAKAPPSSRTLQDIHIEGEIPVPQVLFITARDQRRFVDFQHRRYLKTSQEVGVQTIFPSEIVLTADPPADEPKETSR